MKKIIISFCAGILVGIAPVAIAVTNLFGDVPEDTWYSSALMNLSSKGIIEGYSDNTFRPSNNVNRAELVVTLDRLLNYLEENGNLKIESVKSTNDMPVSSDPYSFTEGVNGEPTLAIVNDVLSIRVGYGGGCSEHEFDLFLGGIAESEPAQINLKLIHDSNDDFCEALLGSVLQFDLTPIIEKFQSAYHTDTGTVELKVQSNNSSKSILYSF